MAAELIAHNSQQAELIANKPSVPTGKTILTENHKTYDVTTYATAETDIPDPVLIEKTFTENGTYSATEYDADGFENVTVDIQPLLMDKTVEKNGIYKAVDDGVQGYRQVNVNLPFEQKTVTPSTTAQTVTPSQGYEALESVTVEAVQLESATITPTTQQQTYTPQSPAIGFDSVTVEAVSDNYDKFLQGNLTVLKTNVTTLRQRCCQDYTSLVDMDCPNLITIGDYAFYGCRNFNPAQLPNSIININWGAFLNCTSLSLQNLPPNLSAITVSAFQGCSSLAITSFPDSVQKISGLAFDGCTGIPYIDMSELTHFIALANKNAFQNTTFPFYFKDQAQLDEYATATNWSALASRFQIKGA